MQQDSDPDERIPYLQFWGIDVQAEVLLNGIPLASCMPGAFATISTGLREVLVNGENTVELRVGAQDQPVRQGGWSGKARADVRIADFREGETLGETDGIERTSLRAVFPPEGPNPTRFATRFQARVADGWGWQRATPIDPENPNVRQLLNQFIAGVHQVWRARDITPLLPLYEPMVRDRVRAYPVLDFDLVMEDVARTHLFFDPQHWRVPDIDPSRLIYRSYAGGRLIQAVDPDGLPFVRTELFPAENSDEDPRYCGFSRLFGVLDGRLQILY